MDTKSRPLNTAIYLSLLMLISAGLTPVYAADGERASMSTESVVTSGDSKATVVAEQQALVTSGTRAKSTRGTAQQATGVASAPNIEFWIYDADVDLYSDFDGDGYFVGIDLMLDADTIYSVADVYAVVYLSYDFGPWNEYTATDDFTIFGASGNDAYRIETELLAGYATGDYDILIELFDSYDGTFLASFGPEDSAEMTYLPLEDANRDTPERTTVIVNQGGGGSLGLLGLFALLGIAARRRFS